MAQIPDPRRRALCRAWALGIATALVTAASAASGYGQAPTSAQLFFLVWASLLSGLLAGRSALPPSHSHSKKKSSLYSFGYSDKGLLNQKKLSAVHDRG